MTTSSTTTEKALAEAIADALIVDESVWSTTSYEEAGVLTSDEGLVVRTQDGSEFQVTIIRSR